MGQDEVQDQLNNADKSDVSKIYILSHYWKQSNGAPMVRFTGLYAQGEDEAKYEDVKFDYLETLEIYII